MENALFTLTNVGVRFERNIFPPMTLKATLGRMMRTPVRKGYDALTGIDLAIHDGDRIGVIGRNGAGKSTLLRVLTGVITPQSGRVHVKAGKHIVPLLELGIGFHPDLSGRENCILAGILMGYSRPAMAGRIDAINRFAELGEFIDQPVKTYSTGMYARLAFSLATDINPDVLVVDEVFGVGDEFFMRRCIARMQRLMRQGATVVFVSHNLDFLATQCSRILWLDGGRLVMDGVPDEVVSAYRTSEVV